MNSTVILRMRDVAVCLHYARQYSFSLSKIQLQKLIYLLDSISAFFYVLSIRKGHHTYFHGPYDKNIQNAADSLVIYGFANVKNIKFMDNGTSSCEYYLTENGEDWVNYLIHSESNTSLRAEIVKNLLESLLTRGLFEEIVQLVYAEPLFVKNQRKGFGVDLDFEDLDENDVFNFLLIVLYTYETPKERKLIPFVCDLYINYLEQRRIALAISDGEE